MNNWITILTIISSCAAVIGAVFGFFKWFMNIFTQKFADSDKRFEKMEDKFEILDNRIFELAMGKSLKQILLEEKDMEKEKRK